MPEFLSVALAGSRAGRLSASGCGESSCGESGCSDCRSSETELTSAEADPSGAEEEPSTSVTDSMFMLLYGRSAC